MFRAMSNDLRQTLRRSVCPRCFRRPPGSDAMDGRTPRKCEAGCAIFNNLEALNRIVGDADADPCFDYDAAIQWHICRVCDLSATAGRFCHKRADGTCPLSRYARSVTGELEPKVLKHCGAD